MATCFRYALMMACLVALSGCSSAKPKLEKPDFDRGARVFDASCANCHLDADHEAPQLDEADDWDVDTQHWASIVDGHAKQGYLKLAANGGHSGLDGQNLSDVLHFIEVKLKAQ